jgi:RNA polymerase sigma factor (sigma-70 family)
MLFLQKKNEIIWKQSFFLDFNLKRMLSEVINITTWNQLRSGDLQALLCLYKEYYVALINFGIKMTGNRELTSDCISQVLIKLWNRHQQLPEVENIRSYLISCLKNELLIELKNANKIKSGNNSLKYALTEQEISYEEYLIQTQTNLDIKNNLSRAFSHLSKREKQLLQLKFFEDLSYDEIALKCNITKRTAYNIIYDALKSLKADFGRVNPPALSHNPWVLIPITILSQLRFLYHFF